MTDDRTYLSIKGAGEVLILLRVALLREAGKSEMAKTAADLASLPADFEKLLKPHVEIHGGIFLRSRLDLNGGADRMLSSEELISKSKAGATSPALLEKLNDSSRYNILCSRGALMPNLQGIWTGMWSSYWSGDFTMNGNLQTAMAANQSANMAECLEPYWRFFETNMPTWYEGKIEGIRCRSNFEVRALDWSHGKISAVLRSGSA